MPDFSFLILYVDDPLKSAAFYADLLGQPIREQAPTFAMLPLREGVMLGLWLRHAVEPAAAGAVGAGEIAFTVADAGAVSKLHDDWAARGLTIAQAPARMDFGTTFVALDPDGHRLRVFAPEAGS
jgi:catechol 2,3-dioxygenase-like lactoylglutathione lyase family enzyme